MAQKVVAMILAGGKGTRLKALTKKIAKPAVHFGGKYRIIDFSLSNVANSDITVCGVLTQYESAVLSNYVGNGSTWGFDLMELMVNVNHLLHIKLKKELIGIMEQLMLFIKI